MSNSDNLSDILQRAMESTSAQTRQKAEAERSTIQSADLLKQLYTAQLVERQERIDAEKRRKEDQDRRDKTDRRRFIATIAIGVLTLLATIIGTIMTHCSLPK